VDPLPFLFGAVLIFGAVQLGTYYVYVRTRPKPPAKGLGKIKQKDFITLPIPDTKQ